LYEGLWNDETPTRRVVLSGLFASALVAVLVARFGVCLSQRVVQAGFLAA
jgi:hypothetical protein